MKATDLTDREIFAAVFGAAYTNGLKTEYAEATGNAAVEAVRAMRPKLATVGEWTEAYSTHRREYAGDDAAAIAGTDGTWNVFGPGEDGDMVASGSANSLDEAKAMCDAVLAVLEARR